MSSKELSIFVALFIAGILLSLIHSIFAVLTFGLFAVIAYMPLNWVSKRLFKKDLVIPSKYLPNQNLKWSDWLLFIPFLFAFILPTFAIGEVADCFLGTEIWEHIYWFCQ